jgi:hypothetical protein
MTTTMPQPPSPKSPRFALAVSAFALISLAFAASPARADILGECSAITDVIQCPATAVGKPCQGGGKCLAIPCSASQKASMIYGCDTCPTIVSVPDGTCTLSNIGTTCGNSGDGGTGTCAIISPQCQASTGAAKISCQIPSTEHPTGPPAGDGGPSSGCGIAPKPMTPTAVGLGLIAAGLVAFFVDRARRRSRS